MEVDSGMGSPRDGSEEVRYLFGLSMSLLFCSGGVLIACFCDWFSSERGVGSFSEKIQDFGWSFLLCFSHTSFVVLFYSPDVAGSHKNNHSIVSFLVLVEEEK